MHNGCVDPTFGDFVEVYTTASVTDGYLTKGLLEAKGIRVLMKGNAEGPYRMGPVYLLVPAEDRERAKMVLETPVEELSDEELAAEAEAAGPAEEAPD